MTFWTILGYFCSGIIILIAIVALAIEVLKWCLKINFVTADPETLLDIIGAHWKSTSEIIRLVEEHYAEIQKCEVRHSISDLFTILRKLEEEGYVEHRTVPGGAEKNFRPVSEWRVTGKRYPAKHKVENHMPDFA